MGPKASCAECDYSASGVCVGGRIELFSDTSCTNDEVDVPADGQCHPAPVGIGLVQSYQYTPGTPANTSCAPISPPETLTNFDFTETVCCVP